MGREVTWQFHPLKSRPGFGGFCLLLALASAYSSVLFVGNLVFSLPIIAFFLYSLHPFFLPSRYTLDGRGVRVRTVFGSTNRSWETFGGFQVARNGVLLTRLARPSTLDRWKGLFLYAEEGTDRERLIDYVKERFE